MIKQQSNYSCYRIYSGPLDQLIIAAFAALTQQGLNPQRAIIHRSIDPATVKVNGYPVEHLPNGGPQPYEIWIEIDDPMGKR